MDGALMHWMRESQSSQSTDSSQGQIDSRPSQTSAVDVSPSWHIFANLDASATPPYFPGPENPLERSIDDPIYIANAYTIQENTPVEHSGIHSLLSDSFSWMPNSAATAEHQPLARGAKIRQLNSTKNSHRFPCDYCPEVAAIHFKSAMDLERHKKSVHGIYRIGSRYWLCPVLGCPRSSQRWPRLDNFKSHIKSIHPGQDIADAVSCAERVVRDAQGSSIVS